MPYSHLTTTVRNARRIRWFVRRGLILAAVLAAALIGLSLGADVSDRPGLTDAGFLTRLYYSIGLFVLGGLDLGTPVGGSTFARGLLWFAYFAAPAVTASAVTEGLVRAMDPDGWRMRRLSNHIIIGGCGRLTMLYLARLRAENPLAPVIIVEEKVDHPNAAAAKELYRARVVHGTIGSPDVLDTLAVDRARRVMLFTGDDFSNLDAAAKILLRSPELGPRMVVHVSDLTFKRQIAHTRVARSCKLFNTYQRAASHLVETELLPHFEATEARDLLILAGFGRLGQTVLDELHSAVQSALAQVIIVDTEAEERAAMFEDQVGFSSDYEHEVVTGAVGHLRLWQELETRYDLANRSPVIILAAGDDTTNLRVALRLSGRYENGLVVARTYFGSSFAEDVSGDAGFHTFSVATLTSESLPDSWLS